MYVMNKELKMRFDSELIANKPSIANEDLYKLASYPKQVSNYLVDFANYIFRRSVKVISKESKVLCLAK